MKRRVKTYKKREMTPARQKELQYFCLQYREWINKLNVLYPSVKSQKLDSASFTSTNEINDETADLAIKRAALIEKIEMVEKSAQEASPDLWKYIIIYACDGETFGYLQGTLKIPISEASFRDIVREFFDVLGKKRN